MRTHRWTIAAMLLLLPSAASALPGPAIPLEGTLAWKGQGTLEGLLVPLDSDAVAVVSPLGDEELLLGASGRAELILHRWYNYQVSDKGMQGSLVTLPGRTEDDVTFTRIGTFGMKKSLALHGLSSSAPTAASCAIVGPDAASAFTLPFDSKGAVRGDAKHGLMQATCEGGAFAGDAQTAYFFGYELRIQSASRTCVLWTGTRSSAEAAGVDSCGFAPAPTVQPASLRSSDQNALGETSQMLEVRTSPSTPFALSLDDPGTVAIRSHAFSAAGTLSIPESTGHLLWGGQATEGTLAPLQATGVFRLAGAGYREVDVSGHTTEGPGAAPQAVVAGPTATSSAPILAIAGASLAFLGLAAFLFSKLNKSDVLEHPRRAAILDIVKREPGVETNAVARALGLRWPKAAYHVERLQRAGEIVVRRVGGRTALFPANGGHRGREQGIVLQRRATPRRALEALRATPDLDQAALATTLGLHQSQASRVLTALREAGLIEAAMADGRTRYRVVDAPQAPQEPF